MANEWINIALQWDKARVTLGLNARQQGGKYIVFTLSCVLLSCNFSTCHDALMNFIDEEGSFIIDTFYLEPRVHASMFESKDHRKIKYDRNDFIIAPSKGDSIIKIKGVYEYVLIKKDSTYVFSFCCKRLEPFFVDKWKNGEKNYIPSSKPIPDCK